MGEEEKQLELIYERLEEFDNSLKEFQNEFTRNFSDINNRLDRIDNGVKKQNIMLLEIINTLDKAKERRVRSMYSKPYSDKE